MPAIKGDMYINTHCNYSQPTLIKLDNENIGGHLTPLQTHNQFILREVADTDLYKLFRKAKTASFIDHRQRINNSLNAQFRARTVFEERLLLLYILKDIPLDYNAFNC